MKSLIIALIASSAGLYALFNFSVLRKILGNTRELKKYHL
jgi:hypothetical protein